MEQSPPTGNELDVCGFQPQRLVLVCQHRSRQAYPDPVRHVTSFFHVPAPSSGNPHFLLSKVVSVSQGPYY